MDGLRIELGDRLVGKRDWYQDIQFVEFLSDAVRDLSCRRLQNESGLRQGTVVAAIVEFVNRRYGVEDESRGLEKREANDE